jgi:arylsulfatase A-like enzyme
MIAAALLLVACAGDQGTPDVPAPVAPRGIVVISVDTLRADHVAGWGPPDSATPSLAALGARSTRFTRAFSQANETLFSHGSLFTSQIPSALAFVDYDWTIPSGTPTLAGALTDAGWRTGAMVASGHLARVFGLDDGFEDYVEAQRWGSFQETVPMAVNWLERAAASEEPFFLFVHSYDCHAPYAKPGVLGRSGEPGYDGPILEPSGAGMFFEQLYEGAWYPDFVLSTVSNRGGNHFLTPAVHDLLPEHASRPESRRVALSLEDRDWINGLYETSAFYADAWIGVLLAELERRGLDDRTAVVVVSDHGEGLMDHGFHTHRGSLHDSVTHVPFLLHLPGEEAREVSSTVSLLDVAPTLLSWAGVAAPEAMQGRDLTGCATGGDCPEGGVAYSESVRGMVSATDGTHRLVVSGAPAASAGMRELLEEAELGGEGITLYDTRPGPGQEVAVEDAAAFEALKAAALEFRGQR